MGSNWRTWTVTLMLLLGLCFEVFKQIPVNKMIQKDPIADLAADQYLVNGRTSLSPFQAMRKAAPVAVAHSRPLVHAAPKPTDLETSTAETSFQENQDKGGEQTVAQTEETKKKKKKKKKKKTDEAAQSEEVIAEALPDEDTEPPKRTTPVATGSGDVVVTQIRNANPAEVNAVETPMTAAQWIELIKKNPSTQSIDKLVAAYNSREIQAATFYAVIEALLTESDANLKQLGVDGLDRTPSVASFIMLADLIRAENQDPAVRQKIDVALAKYESVEQLNTLHTIMQNSDNSAATLLATQKLDLAIKKYSQVPSEQPQSNSIYARQFQRFVPLLETLEKSDDTSIAAQAAQTLASLQSYLNSSVPNTAGL